MDEADEHCSQTWPRRNDELRACFDVYQLSSGVCVCVHCGCDCI